MALLDKKDSYRDSPLLKRAGVELNYTQAQVEEYMKCAKDPVYFAINYMQIVNVDEGLMPFKMWDFQKEMLNVFKDNRFVITKCPRQIGKCVNECTTIVLRNKKTGAIIESSIGDFYDREKANLLRKEQGTTSKGVY